MGFYNRGHYRLVSPPADTKQDIADRCARIAAMEQAERERKERWPIVTLENFDEQLAWREARYDELLKRGTDMSMEFRSLEWARANYGRSA